MLNKQYLTTIYHAIADLPEWGDSNPKQIILAELKFQEASESLWEERSTLLDKATLTDAEESRLKALGKQLEQLSSDRPAEFGGMFHAQDVEASNIIRQAGRVLAGYVSVDLTLLADAHELISRLCLSLTSEMLATAGEYTEAQSAQREEMTQMIDRLDAVLSKEARS